MATTAIPEGRVGNLTAEHEKILKKFWEKFLNTDDAAAATIIGDASKDKSKPYGRTELHNAFWAYATRESADSVMLRFLRARSWDIEKAYTMLTNALKWRISFGVSEITDDGEPVLNDALPGFVSQMKSGKAYLHGADKQHRPVFYIHVKLHSPKDQPAAALEKFTVYSLETGRLFLAPPLAQCCLVFDLTSFGLKNMDWSFILFLTKSFEAYYPETLGLVLVHNAPWVFWGVWKVLSPLLDPVVRQKIAFTQSAKELMQYIDPGQLPKAMGGSEEWAWKYTDPSPARSERFNNTAAKKEKIEALNAIRTRFDAKTKEWINSSAPEIEAQRNALALELKIAGIESDAYLHPQSVYHEQGNVKDDGTIEWHYKSDSGVQKLGVPVEEYKAQLAKMNTA